MFGCQASSKALALCWCLRNPTRLFTEQTWAVLLRHAEPFGFPVCEALGGLFLRKPTAPAAGPRANEGPAFSRLRPLPSDESFHSDSTMKWLHWSLCILFRPVLELQGSFRCRVGSASRARVSWWVSYCGSGREVLVTEGRSSDTRT